MSRTPLVRPISWPKALINLAIAVSFAFVGWLLYPKLGIPIGIFTYTVLSYVLRAVLTSHHKRGIALCKQKQFTEAIPEFERSLAFFRHHAWLDDYSAITMLSFGGMSYREMSLVSLAFCYGQLGDGTKSRTMYEQCLKEFPESGMAEAALRLMDAAANAATPR